MSWGIVCNNRNKCSHILTEPLCLTMVTLEPDENISDPEMVSLMLDFKGEERLLCTLIHGKLMQQLVNLKFNKDDELTFFVKGHGTIHVLGHEESKVMENIFSNMNEIDDSTDESEEADDIDNTVGTEYLLGLDNSEDDDLSDKDYKPHVADFDEKPVMRSNKKKVNFAENSIIVPTEDSYILPSIKPDDEEESDVSNSEDNDSEMEDEEITEEDTDNSEDDVEEVPISKKRKSNLSNSQSKRLKIMDADEVKAIQSEKKSHSKKHKKKQNTQSNDKNIEAEKDENDDMMNSSIGRTPMPKKKLTMVHVKCPSASMPPPSSSPNRKSSGKGSLNFSQKLPNGLEYEDLKVGGGPIARKGKLVHVYYSGHLLDGTIFDKCLKPKKPFAFRLGKGEVIKGWDLGIEGMQTGGKRRLKVPSSMAYGKKGQHPIPPNSTLIFTVEVQAISG